MTRKPNIIIAITGASGSIYALHLLKRLQSIRDQWGKGAIVFSPQAQEIWKYELPQAEIPSQGFQQYESMDFSAPFASGSASYDIMWICPCSMGTLGRIASGVSDSLISRAADVMLKEKRRLMILLRETPLSLIHLRNMVSLTEAGAMIYPAAPSFYHRPENIQDLVTPLIDRLLDAAGFDVDMYRWNS